MSYTESQYENAIIELFRDKLGYTYFYGPDVVRDYRKPYYEDMLIQSLETINPKAHPSAIQEAFYKITHYDTNNLIQINQRFTDYLQNGVEVSYIADGEQKNTIVKLIEYDDDKIHKNSFCIINQWTVFDVEEKRPDVVIFINGFPLVLIELKSCSREETDASEAYRQIRNYLHAIPSIFQYNAFCILSDLVTSKAGTITSDEDHYMEWKSISGDYEETKFASFSTLFEGIFEKSRLLDIIKNFILFSNEPEKPVKILAGYHQYFAVNKAVISTRKAVFGDGKAGIFWHTQGSGKSLSMVFYTRLLQDALSSPTIVVVTDRNDLDDQLFGTFSKCAVFLRQTPQQAENRNDLKKLLAGRKANGIIFTTMQKFEESDEALSERDNIILMADEAHRSQYGLTERVDEKTGKVNIGYARLVRNSLPNASCIGFTGTPISLDDRSTIEVFGDYIDIYDMTQSVADGATKPIFYENRVINLGLDEATLHKIDMEYEIISENAEEYHIEKSKKQLSQMESILGAEETIKTLCADIVAHYEDRADILTGKAMIVAYSRPIAIKIYKEILRLRPLWIEKIKVIMTGSNDDPEGWKDIIGSKADKTSLARKFKDDADPMKIAIVVDMWLTGFDVPSLATMYVYKPMQGHNLMQAIARVNRVFKDKEGGLIVDYVGIAAALKQAMSDFTRRDRKNFGNPNIAGTALPKFMEKLSVCQDLFHGFQYSKFITGSDLDRANIIVDGINFIIGAEDKKNTFIKQALLLKQAETLCRSLLSHELRFEFAFFEAVRTSITHITLSKKLSLKEINERINALLQHSIKSEGIINIFKDETTEFSIFDEKFLNEIASMKQKNLSVELLKKLLQEQVTVYQRSNLVKSELFSEKLKRIINAYRNGQITNAEVIEELLKMAHEIADDHNEGKNLGLTWEEKAFYDALIKPEALKDFYSNEVLIAITKELAELLKKSRTVDWNKKETARSEMRSMVKRLLKKYKYPPEEIPNATEYVLAQCEQWSSQE